MFGEVVVLLWSAAVVAALIRQWRSGDLAAETGERPEQQPVPASVAVDASPEQS